MATIIDRRRNGKGKSSGNRKRFIDRYKRKIKKSVDDLANQRNIKDVFNEGNVTISGDDISEPSFGHNPKAGNKEYVLPGNKEYGRGENLPKPEEGQGSGSGGGKGEDGEDDFTFTLSKKEFLDMYFGDMGLPRYIKDSINNSTAWKWKKAGYTTEGIPARLNVKKTLEQAIARRIATKSQGKKPRFLDDEDIRYDHFTKKALPIRHAVMFCLMDVSASMGEEEKTLAKKFFMLLYLFLHKEYESVEIIFIRHTENAEEVDEETFFHDRINGGTMISSAYRLMNEIIEERIDANSTNIYMSQVSDGDNFAHDDQEAIEILIRDILPKIQYGAYIQAEQMQRRNMKLEYYGAGGVSDMFAHLTPIAEQYEHFNIGRVFNPSDVYPVLRELFKKG